MDEPVPKLHRHRLIGLIARVFLPALLGGLLFAQTTWFRRTTSETFDEYTYLRLGICIFRNNDFRSMASPMTPPLPILLEYWLPALQARFVPGTDGWNHQVPMLTRQARLLTGATLGVPLVLVVYGWLTRRRGVTAGVLGGGLLAFSPTVLAAASVATTDACFALFGVAATWFIYRYQARPGWRSFLLMGVGIGLALASKQTAAIFFPVALIEILLDPPARRPTWTGVDYGLRLIFRVATRFGLLVVVAFLIDWACYGFHFAPRFGVAGVYSTIPVIIPMVLAFFSNGDAIMEWIRALGPPLAIDTFVGQMEHARQGHAAFLMGAHSSRGWWSFFPIAIGIKSTPAELICVAVAGMMAIRPATWRDPTRRVWLASALTLLGAGMASSINIGQRYMLLIYPLVVLLSADWLAAKLVHRRGRMIALVGALLAWQASSVAGVMPHYFGYFNFMIGGPSQGYRYLVDSSLDWGQDLPSLRRELEARGYRSVALSYFGTANSSIYGLKVTDFYGADDAGAAACDWLAISATGLMESYGAAGSPMRRFRNLPATQVGYSIFLYDLKDPQIRQAWDALRARHRASEEEMPPGFRR